MFKYQMKRAFPNACLSDSDIHQALHFVKFIMKLQPEKRPSASRVKMHPFLKTDSNPFLKELNEYLKKETDGINPFVRMTNSANPKNHGCIEKSKTENKSTKQKIDETEDDPKSHGDIAKLNMKIASVKDQEIVTSQNNVKDTRPPSCFQQRRTNENDACSSMPCDASNNLKKSSHKSKTSGRNIYNWLRKHFNRVFKRKMK